MEVKVLLMWYQRWSEYVDSVADPAGEGPNFFEAKVPPLSQGMDDDPPLFEGLDPPMGFSVSFSVWFHVVLFPDPGEGPGGPSPPLFLDQTEAQRAEKNLFEAGVPPLSQVFDFM